MKSGNKEKNRAVVALSGGVDSAAAALILKEKGYALTGFFMRLGNPGEEAAERTARAVCRRLDMPLRALNFADQFQAGVIDYYLKSYRHGLTPNPCVRCNELLKFGELYKRARELGAAHLATGHYARIKNLELKIKNGGGRRKGETMFLLLKGRDVKKDQSYFLYRLTQEQLGHVLFPLGGLKKEEARTMADQAGLPYIKKESQDVCFLHANGRILPHNDFLKKRLKLKPGPIMKFMSSRAPQGRGDPVAPCTSVNLQSPEMARDRFGLLPGNDNSEVIGKHDGLPLYTLGQRQGIEIGGTGPYYAARMDYRANTLYVVNRYDDPALFCRECVALEVNWVAGREPRLPCRCEAVIRYRHPAVGCEVGSRKQEAGSKTYSVEFAEPQRAVMPGQSVVFYNEDEVLGGGVIGF